MSDINRQLPPGLGGTRQQEAQSGQEETGQSNAGHLAAYLQGRQANRLTEISAAGLANTGHHMVRNGGQQTEATAVVQVANMLAELMEWRRGERAAHVLDSEKGQARAWEAVYETIRQNNPDAFGKGGSGASMARAELERLYKLEREAESAKRVIQELERMGWLMKAKP